MKIRKLNNKGSVWAWVVMGCVILLLSLTWVGFNFFFNQITGSIFRSTIETYPTQWGFFKFVINFFLIALIGGCFWWAISASSTPRSGYM